MNPSSVLNKPLAHRLLFPWLGLILLAGCRVFSQSEPTITWSGGANGDWNVAANWSPVRVPNATDQVLIDRAGGARVRLNAAASVASLTLGGSASATQELVMDLNFNLALATNSFVSTYGVLTQTNGSLMGPALLSVAGRWDWAGGTSPRRASVSKGGRLVMRGHPLTWTSGDNANPAVFTNRGLVVWSGTPVSINHGTRIENYGEWRLASEFRYAFNYTAGDFGTFWNHGVLSKTGGAEITTIQSLAHFHNLGVISNISGVLEFNQSSTWADGSTVAGSAVTRLAGDVITMNGIIHLLGPLELRGARITGEWTFHEAGPFRWYQGTIGGKVTWPTGLGVEILTPADKHLNSTLEFIPAVLTNYATVRQTDGTLFFSFGARIENFGEWRVEADRSVFTLGSGRFGTFRNHHVFAKTAGQGKAVVQQLELFHNFGMVSNASGELDFNVNSVWESGSALANIRISGITWTLNGNVRLLDEVELASGTINGNGTLDGPGPSAG